MHTKPQPRRIAELGPFSVYADFSEKNFSSLGLLQLFQHNRFSFKKCKLRADLARFLESLPVYVHLTFRSDE